MTGSDQTRTAGIALGAAFTAAGISHVVKHKFFGALVPESLALSRTPLGAVTAAIHFVSGLSTFVPRLRVLARWANLGMLVPTLSAALAQTRHPGPMRALG